MMDGAGVADTSGGDTVFEKDELLDVILDVTTDVSSTSNTNSNMQTDFISDPLLKYLNTNTSTSAQINPYFDAQKAIIALQTDGYYHIPSVLTKEECMHGIEQMWDFVQDVSSGIVVREDPTTWYSSNQLETNRMNDVKNQEEKSQYNSSEGKEDTDPWPHTGYSSFPDMFQSLGAGTITSLF